MKTNLLFSLETTNLLLISGLIITIITIVILIFHIIKFKKYEKKYNSIWEKFDSKAIEQDIENIVSFMEKTQNECKAMRIKCNEIDGKTEKCIQKVGIIKYDAYDGGNSGLSFAIALLDNKDNGIIINSVYNRNFSNVYAKEVIKGEIKGNTISEEKEALKKALNNKSFM